MKKFTFLAVMFLAAISLVALTACSEDDENGSIEGKWYYSKVELEGVSATLKPFISEFFGDEFYEVEECVKQSWVEFKAGGSYVEFEACEGEGITNTGTWSLSDGVLTTKATNKAEGENVITTSTLKIKSITSSTLIIDVTEDLIKDIEHLKDYLDAGIYNELKKLKVYTVFTKK